MKYRIAEVIKPGKVAFYFTQKRVLWFFWMSMHKSSFSAGTDIVHEPIRFSTYKDAERAIRETVLGNDKTKITYHDIKI